MSQFRDAYDEFRRHEAEVATVSVDSPFSHREWAKQLDIPFPMLSDFNRDLLTKYDALAPDVGFFSKIGTYAAFVVDSESVLWYVQYPPEKIELSPVGEVLEAVRSVPETVH